MQPDTKHVEERIHEDVHASPTRREAREEERRSRRETDWKKTEKNVSGESRAVRREGDLQHQSNEGIEENIVNCWRKSKKSLALLTFCW